MSYSQNLVVPHPLKVGGDNPESLYALLEADNIKFSLAQASSEGCEAYDLARLQAAEHIANLVHAALWYPDSRQIQAMGIKRPLGLEAIIDQQATNCYGYTIVASECFEAAQMEHWISYANGHAFIVLPPSARRRPAYFVDMLQPDLTQSLAEDTISKGDFDTVANDIKVHKRGAIALHTDQLAKKLLPRDFDMVSENLPWLARKSTQVMTSRYRFGLSEEQHEAKRRNASTLIMSLFSYPEGRIALENLVGFENSLATGQPEQALAHIEAMAGLYPEMDARDRHSEIRSLIGQLCRQQKVLQATKAVEWYMASFAISNDPRFAILEGDCWRQIYEADTTNMQALERARQSYTHAEQSSHYRYSGGLLVGKLASVGLSQS